MEIIFNLSPRRLWRRAEADLEDIFAHSVRTRSIGQAKKTGQPRLEVGAQYLALSIGSHVVAY